MVDRTPRPRSLWPREHGAYIQLSVPLATAVIASPSLAGAALAVAACLAFLASEPLRVAVGQRGRRLQQSEGRRARLRATVLGGGSVALAAICLALAPASIRPVAAAALAGGLLVAVLAWRGKVHSLVGEMIAATALSGAAAPVLVAGGASSRAAIVMWAAWSLGYATTVIAVHHVLARNRRPASRADVPRWIAFVVVAGTIAAVASFLALGWLAAPLAVGSLVVLLWTPRARHLRAIGIAFLVSSLLGAAYAVALLHTSSKELASRVPVSAREPTLRSGWYVGTARALAQPPGVIGELS